MKFRALLCCLGTFMFVSGASAADGRLLINEILLNPPGATDAPYEYIEFRGQPNSLLTNGTYLVAVEGDTDGNPGTVQDVFDLSGRAIGQNGFLVLLMKGHTYKPNSLSTVVTNRGSEDGWGSGSESAVRHKGELGQTEIENPSCTFILIQSAVSPAPGDDIDTDDDGIPDGAVFSAWMVLDSIGILDSDSDSDRAYGAINFRRDSAPGNSSTALGNIIPLPFTPGYIGRNGNSTNSTLADWVASDNLTGNAPNWRLGLNRTGLTNTFPRSRSTAYLNHIGAQNFGAPAPPAIVMTQTGAVTRISEGGASGYFKLRLALAARFGGVKVRIDPPPGLQISTDGVQYYSTSRVVTLTSTTAKTIRVRSPQDNVVDVSTRLRVVTNTVISTLDTNRYPTSTIILPAKFEVIDNDIALLSEVKVNPPGEDAPFEFVELKGPPKALLTNIYLIAVDGNGGGNPGLAQTVVNLTGHRFGSNGLLVIAGDSNPYGFPSSTPVVLPPAFSQPGGALNNGPLSLLLVGSPEPLTAGSDLDAGNNGKLEGLAEGSVVLDALGWSDGGNDDHIYGGVDLTQERFVPDAATRLRTNNTPRSAAAWIVGDLAGTTGDSLAYDDVNVSTNFPLGTRLSAGSTNNLPPIVSKLEPFSSVIGDPTPAVVTFTVKDEKVPASAITVTVTSTNQAVVPDANLTATRISGGTWRLTINPIGVGYSDIVISASNGALAGRSILHYAASAMGRSNAVWHTGISDASTAMALDANWMLVGDDENQTLRIYSRTKSGGAAKATDMNPFLGLTDFYPTGIPREVDIEASTRVGNRLYWIGSYSHAYNGEARTNRGRLFTTDLSGSGSNSVLKFAGRYDFFKSDFIDWDQSNAHGKGADYFGLAASDADGVDPKAPDGSGLSVESLCMAPGSSTKAFVGFRAPLVPPTTRAMALILVVTNFSKLAVSRAGPGETRFGVPIELDLGGRGIRSMEGNASGYVIIAGPPGFATGIPPSDFRLYTWTGRTNDAPQQRDTDLRGFGFNPEGIVQLPTGTWTSNSLVEILSDNGITVYYGDTNQAKHLLVPNFKKFRTDWVKLGNVVGGAQFAPTVAASGPEPLLREIAIENGQVTLTWNATPGAEYRIEFREKLDAGEWREITSSVAQSLVGSTTVPMSGSSQGFYRVRPVVAGGP
jgi:hypothetical protein